MEAEIREGIHPQRFEVLGDVVQNIIQFLHEQRLNIDVMHSDVDQRISRIVHVGDSLLARVGDVDGDINEVKKTLSNMEQQYGKNNHTMSSEMESLNARVRWLYRQVSSLVGRHEASPSKNPYVPLIQQIQTDISTLQSRHNALSVEDIKVQLGPWVREIITKALEPFGVEMRNEVRGHRKNFNGDISVAVGDCESQLNKRIDSIQSSIQTLVRDGRIGTLGERVDEIERVLEKLNASNESIKNLEQRLNESFVPFGDFDKHSKSVLNQLVEMKAELDHGMSVYGRRDPTSLDAMVKHEFSLHKNSLMAEVRESSAQYISQLEERVMTRMEDEVRRLMIHEQLSSTDGSLKTRTTVSPVDDDRLTKLEGDIEEVQQMLQSAQIELLEFRQLVDGFGSHEVHESHDSHQQLSLPSHWPSSTESGAGPKEVKKEFINQPSHEVKQGSDTEKVSRFGDFVHRIGMPPSFESGAMKASDFVSNSSHPEGSRNVFGGKFSPGPLAQRPKREGAGLIGEKQVRFHDLHRFFSVHPEAQPENEDNPTSTGTEAHIRGLFSSDRGDMDNDFGLLDRDTKKDIQRFIKRPTFDGDYATFFHFERHWDYWLKYWSASLTPELRTLALLSALPSEDAAAFWDCVTELGWGYDHIWAMLKEEAAELQNPHVLEQEWKDTTPPNRLPMPYRRWFLKFQVLFNRVGTISAQTAKKTYMDALARAKCFQKEVSELLEVEAMYGESTFQEAHSFILRKLVLRRRAEVLAKRYGSGVGTENIDDEAIGNLRGRRPANNDDRGSGKGRPRQQGGKGRSQSEPPKCTTCGKAHNGSCWIVDKTHWPKSWKEQKQVPHKTIMQRLKDQKCIWCGGDHLGVKCEQNPFRKDTARGKQEKNTPEAKKGPYPPCKHCGKTNHTEASCFTAHPELRQQWRKSKDKKAP